VHAEFPVRKDASELRALLVKGAQSLGAGVQEGLAWVDVDGNGSLDRKEVGKAYSAFKNYFLKGASTLQTMGPMLAMFGGMDAGGMPGGMGGMGGIGGMGQMPRGRGRGRGRGPP